MDQEIAAAILEIELGKISVVSAKLVDLIVIRGDQDVLQIAPDEKDLEVFLADQKVPLASSMPMAFAENDVIGLSQLLEELARTAEIALVENIRTRDPIGDGSLF